MPEKALLSINKSKNIHDSFIIINQIQNSKHSTISSKDVTKLNNQKRKLFVPKNRKKNSIVQLFASATPKLPIISNNKIVSAKKIKSLINKQNNFDSNAFKNYKTKSILYFYKINK